MKVSSCLVKFIGSITSQGSYPWALLGLNVNTASKYVGFLKVYLTIIPRARIGYEVIDSQRGA